VLTLRDAVGRDMVRSSFGPPGLCITPSTNRKVVTVSFIALSFRVVLRKARRRDTRDSSVHIRTGTCARPPVSSPQAAATDTRRPARQQQRSARWPLRPTSFSKPSPSYDSSSGDQTRNFVAAM
jgi:hypothetical protein